MRKKAKVKNMKGECFCECVYNEVECHSILQHRKSVFLSSDYQ